MRRPADSLLKLRQLFWHTWFVNPDRGSQQARNSGQARTGTVATTIYTKTEACELLKISGRSMQRLIAEGRLTPLPLPSKRVLFSEGQLEAFIRAAERQTQPA